VSITSNRKITLYVKDPKEFHQISYKIKELWYRKFGISLSKGNILNTALQFTVDKLEDDTSNVLQDEQNSILDRYARISS
jgi:hypothetical protein